MVRQLVIVSAVLGVGGLTLPAAAQSPLARVTVGGGTATDIRGIRSAAYTLSPSLFLFPEPSSVLALGGRGTSFTTGEWAVGGHLYGYSRQRLFGPLATAAVGSGEVTRTSYDVTFLVLDATPGLELELGPVTLHGGWRSALARTSGPGTPDPLLPPTTRVETRTASGPAFGGSLRIPVPGLGPGLVLGYREERVDVEAVRVTDRQGTVRFAAGPFTVQGAYGRRAAPDEDAGFGGVSLTARVSPLISVFATAERYPSNRLTGAFAGRTVSAGVALQVGGRRTPRSLPKPSGVEDAVPGLTRVSIRAPDAKRVELAGDWNGWKPEPARRAENGVWYLDLALRPGEYRYAFRIDGTTWAVPEGAAAMDDGFGGKSAWLTVRAPERTAGSTQDPNQEEA